MSTVSSNSLQAVTLLLDLLNVMVRVNTQLSMVSDLIRAAQAEGRDLTDEELQKVVDSDNAARKALEEAITAAG